VYDRTQQILLYKQGKQLFPQSQVLLFEVF